LPTRWLNILPFDLGWLYFSKEKKKPGRKGDQGEHCAVRLTMDGRHLKRAQATLNAVEQR